MKKEFARTGCLLMDLMIGGGEGLGVPYGTGLNLVGCAGSGKSMIGNEIVAAEYHLGGKKDNLKWQYEDVERGNRFDTEKLYGIDIVGKNVMEGAPDTVQDLDARHSLFLEKLGKKDYGIYVLDSLDLLRDQERKERQEERKNAYEKGKGFDKGTFGMGTARFLSQEFFRNHVGSIADKNSLLIFISQARQNLDPMSFKKWTQSGGNALYHFMTTTVWFSRVNTLKNDNLAIGGVFKAKIEKARHPRPFRECIFTFYFDHGIDDIGTSLDYLFDLRGKNGLHLVSANNIPWGTAGLEKTAENYVQFLKDNNFHSQCKVEREEAEKSSNLTIKWIKQWIENNELAREKAKEVFGEVYSFDELRDKIENDPKMKEELDRRVIAKWEDNEKKVSVNFKRKYQ